MELKWLEDYLALIEAGTFSAAAERRHISQPAFSRRIQMLEDWLGVALIDRNRKPFKFTTVATQHEAEFHSLVAHIYEFRAMLRSDALQSPGLVIAAQHSLATAYLPTFLAQLRSIKAEQNFRIRSENRDECLELLNRGQADILLAYESLPASGGISEQMAVPHTLGQDALVLVASAKLCEAIEQAASDQPLPLLCFPPESFFGRAVRLHALPELMRERQVAVQFVSEFSLGLREMALIDQGAAWLPRSLIAQDLKQGVLRELSDIGRTVPLVIKAYFACHGGKAVQELLSGFNKAAALHGEPPERQTP